MIDAGTGVSITVIGLIVAALGWLFLRFDGALKGERKERDALAAELTAFKLEAIRTFATPGQIKETEQRLANAIDRMTARLETVIGRIEALSNELARQSAGRSGRKPALTRGDSN